MEELPNTVAMDDDSSDDNDDNNANNDTNNNNNTDVYGYLIRIDVYGQEINTFILTKETTTIGRKKKNDIILIDNTVSSNHAEIEIDLNEKEAFVTDLKSTNKTRIGKQIPSKNNQNKKIKANRQSLLRSGDYLTFGDVHFIFYHEDDYEHYQSQRNVNNNNNNNNNNNGILSHSPNTNTKKKRRNLLATESFCGEDPNDDEETKKVKANTRANMSKKDEIDLKLSLSDDETVKQTSPRKVQFQGVDDSQNSNNNTINNENGGNLEPTLAWDDDDDDNDDEDETQDNTEKSIDLAATVAFDDIDDENEDGNAMPATMAFDDDETQDVEQNGDKVGLAATMPFGMVICHRSFCVSVIIFILAFL